MSTPLTIKSERRGGFTLVECLVVVAVVSLLAVMILMRWVGSNSFAQNVQCMSNLQQISSAWRMYAVDNNDVLAPNDYPYLTAYKSINPQHNAYNWVTGTMEQPTDSTNKSELIDTNGSALAHYISNPFLYRCPADNYVDPGTRTNHVRSYSMNSAIGTIWNSHYSGGVPAPVLGSPLPANWLDGRSFGEGVGEFLTYGRMSSFTRPGPSQTWLIMDENSYSMNDGSMAVSAYASGQQTYLIDFASGNHNAGAGMVFVDGHALIHTWQDSRTYSPLLLEPMLRPGTGSSDGSVEAANDVDCLYLAPLTSAKE